MRDSVRGELWINDLITVILMAVVVALVITAIFYQITIGRRQVQAEVPKKVLIVAQQDLPIG